jgi:hypothetical protein
MTELNEEQIRQIVKEETTKVIRNELNNYFGALASNLLQSWSLKDKRIKKWLSQIYNK